MPFSCWKKCSLDYNVDIIGIWYLIHRSEKLEVAEAKAKTKKEEQGQTLVSFEEELLRQVLLSCGLSNQNYGSVLLCCCRSVWSSDEEVGQEISSGEFSFGSLFRAKVNIKPESSFGSWCHSNAMLLQIEVLVLNQKMLLQGDVCRTKFCRTKCMPNQVVPLQLFDLGIWRYHSRLEVHCVKPDWYGLCRSRWRPNQMHDGPNFGVCRTKTLGCYIAAIPSYFFTL